MNRKFSFVNTNLIVATMCIVLANSAPDSLGEDSVRTVTGPLESVDWGSLVGRNVVIAGKLEVVDTFNLVRYGEVRVARERLYVPTSRIDPNDRNPEGVSFTGGSNVAKVVAAQKFNDNAVLTIDDGLRGQNIFPPKLFPQLGSSHPTVRIGSTIDGVAGRIARQNNNYVLVCQQPLRWTPAERPKRPDVGKANVTVASFNVLNYFTTIDNGRNNARGADSESELERQQAKLVSAITALNADVIGIMELENSATAEDSLVAALNEASGKPVFKGCGVPQGFRNAPGAADAIRVALIYRTDRVSTVGGVGLINNPAFYTARTPLVQTFKSKRGGKPFSVIVNHFKSKGGANDANDENKNKGDGQAAYNVARRSQSLAIVDFVKQVAVNQRAPRILILGDLNAYQEEDPIDALRASGLIDLHSNAAASNSRAPHYSYVFRGQSGSLDHAFATGPLAKDVTGIATWHINADEPRFLDYNEEFNPGSLLQTNPFRSSDHDPILIGISN